MNSEQAGIIEGAESEAMAQSRSLESIDLANVTEDELGWYIDDAIDHGKSFGFIDSRENMNVRAVLLPVDVYRRLRGAEIVEPHLGKATQTP